MKNGDVMKLEGDAAHTVRSCTAHACSAGSVVGVSAAAWLVLACDVSSRLLLQSRENHEPVDERSVSLVAGAACGSTASKGGETAWRSPLGCAPSTSSWMGLGLDDTSLCLFEARPPVARDARADVRDERRDPAAMLSSWSVSASPPSVRFIA